MSLAVTVDPNDRATELPRCEPDFEAFYRETRRGVLDSARRLAGSSQHIAEDATSAAFVEMYRKWSTRRRKSFAENRSYVSRIAFRKVADHFRYWQRSRPSEGDIDTPADADNRDGPLPEYLAVLRKIEEQPYRRRAVIVLYFLEEFSYQEIGGILGMNVSTVRTHVQRARADLLPYTEGLKRAMEGRGE
jgi:RNA polymerase sigma factor (sigma-70 family)